MKYFAVTCKHGHHGSGSYLPITFAIFAENAVEASEKAQAMPGVKHDQPCLYCREISPQEYNKLMRVSAYERGFLKK